MNNVAYKNQFTRENYDRISLTVNKGVSEEWKAEATRRNLSLNAFIREAVENYLKQEQ